MAQVTITQLPQAQALTGNESVPIVQNGVTVQTTTGAIAVQPTQTQTFLTATQQPSLANSRYLAVGAGLDTTDGGAQGTLEITLTGAASSLNAAGNGLMVKTGIDTLTPRAIDVGTGLDITNANGVSGDPLIELGAFMANVQSMSGSTGLMGVNAGVVSSLAIAGTANEIAVTNGDGAAGNPTVGLADNPVIPGDAGTVLPIGGTSTRPVGAANGTLRYNSELGLFEGYANDAWGSIATGGGVTSVGTGTGLLGGPITSTGTIDIDDTIVATLDNTLTLTNKTISGSSNTLSNIANASLTNSAITINGTSTSLGGSINVGTVTSVGGTGTVNGLTLTGTVTSSGDLTLGGTLSNVANSALTNSSVIIGTTNISLGATSLTLGGLTSVAVTQDPVSALQVATKQYVDTLVSSGITYHDPVKYEVPDSTGNLNATYNNGTAGVGATLTNAGTLVAFTPDGTVALVNDRILVYNQTNQAENGVYVVTTVGDGSTPWVLTRASDADTYALKDPDGLGNGDAFFITSGNTGAGETYLCNTVGVITFGTTAITFAQISASQVYSAGTGLTLTGTQFSISNTAVTASTYGSASSVPVFAVNAQGQITSVTNTAIAIANTAVSGLGTMSTQNANAVAITGGTASGIGITLGSNLDTNGYDIVGGSFGGNKLVLPAGFGPILQGLYEGNAFIQTGTAGTPNRTWSFLDADGSFNSPGPVVALGGISGGAF